MATSRGLTPRAVAMAVGVTLAILWLLDWTRGAFSPWWLGLLGFIAPPYTTLAWVLIHHYSGSVGPTTNMAHLIILVIALVVAGTAAAATARRVRVPLIVARIVVASSDCAT